MQATVEHRAFRHSSERYPLKIDSAFADLISPLLSELEKIDRAQNAIRPEMDFNWLIKAFPIITKFFEGKNLLDVKLEASDMVFLAGNPIGDCIRRPFVYKLVSQFLENAIYNSEDSVHIKEQDKDFYDKIIKAVRNNGYAPFFSSGENLKAAILEQKESRDFYNDNNCLSEIKSGTTIFSSLIMGECIKNLDIYCNQQIELFQSNYQMIQKYQMPRITDPNHFWKIAHMLKSVLTINMGLLPEKISSPLSLMLLEDNPLHQMAYTPIEKIEGFSWYRNFKDKDQKFHTTAEDAIETLLNALDNNLPLPSALIVDIELSAPSVHMNGLQFLRRVNELLTQAGRKEEVKLFLITSSNPTHYQDEINELISKNMADKFLSKNEFTIKGFLELISASCQVELISKYEFN